MGWVYAGAFFPDDPQPTHICKYTNSLICAECGKPYMRRLLEVDERERDCGD